MYIMGLKYLKGCKYFMGVIYGYMDKMYGCMDVWMYGCMDVWMYGYMNIWIFRYMDIWMYIYNSCHSLSVTILGALWKCFTFVLFTFSVPTMSSYKLHNLLYLNKFTELLNSLYSFFTKSAGFLELTLSLSSSTNISASSWQSGISLELMIWNTPANTDPYVVPLSLQS